MMDNYSNDNSYAGNGWSQYQIYVLNQLKDHNTLLQRLMEKDSEQHVALSLIQKDLKDLHSELEEFKRLLVRAETERTGNNDRISSIEKNRDIDDAVRGKTKAFWATIGAGVTGTIAILLQMADKLWSLFQ